MHHFNKLFASILLTICARDLIIIFTFSARLMAKAEPKHANEPDYVYGHRLADESTLKVIIYTGGINGLINCVALICVCVRLHE